MKSFRYILSTLFLLVLHGPVSGQCPDSNVMVSEEVCTGENLLVINQSSASAFEWDFCANELSVKPEAIPLLANREFQRARDFDLFEDRGQKYLASISSSTGNVSILTFGNSYLNNPVILKTTSVASHTGSAFGLDVVIQDDKRFVFIVATSERMILRLDYGQSWFNEPTITEVIQALGSEPNSINIIEDEAGYAGFVSLENSVLRLDFGMDIMSLPLMDELQVSGSDILRDMEFVKECSRYTAVVTSYQSSEIFRISFEDGRIFGSMSAEPIQLDGDVFNFPAGLGMVREGDSTHVFIQSATGSLVKTAFKGQPTLNAIANNYGNLGISSQNFPFELIKEGPVYYAFSADHQNRRLMRYTFPAECGEDQETSTDPDPVWSFSQPGTKVVSLRSQTGDETSYQSFIVNVQASVAPPASFTINQQCKEDPIYFEFSGDPTGLSFSWDFGDGNFAAGPEASHTYASTGEYTAALAVTSSNGCSNHSLAVISVREDVQAAFSSGTSVICTYQQVLFENESLNAPTNVSVYEWTVNGLPVSDSRDLLYEFTSPGSYDVGLTVQVGNCSDQVLTNLTVLDGPDPSFTTGDVCIGETSVFMNTTSGAFTSILWDFGDGTTSAVESPEHIFASPGIYTVALTAYTASGCETTFTSAVTITDIPVADFTNELACSGQPVVFTDLSVTGTGNVASWAWDFGAAGSSQEQNPVIIFDEPGQYEVLLEVITGAGCASSVSRIVEVSESPLADFNFSEVCAGEPVAFTDASIPAPGTSISQWAWDFGVGISQDQHPLFTFTAPGSYDVTLSVSATDQCAATVMHTVIVPEPPEVLFVASELCAGETVHFADVTVSDEHVVARRWDFDGMANSGDSLASFTFQEPGTYVISLEVETVSGCTYYGSRSVEISPVPQPEFQASALSGPAPMMVEFSNTTQGEETFEWLINNLPVSQGRDLTYTFLQPGSYEVTLRAANAAGCSGTASMTIIVVEPEIDLAANRIIGSFTGVIVEIANYGNVAVAEIPLEVLFPGGSQKMVIRTVIQPGETLQVQLPLMVPDMAEYVCIRIDDEIGGGMDTNPANNSVCRADNLIFSKPYPNPASDRVNIDVFASVDETLVCEWVNVLGQSIPAPDFEIMRSGIYTLAFDISALVPGIYYMRITSGEHTSVFRVSIR